MAESFIPPSRTSLLAERYDEESGSSQFQMRMLGDDILIFRDWYRCTNNYVATYNDKWGNYTLNGEYKYFDTWREPFESPAEVPTVDSGILSLGFPQIYLILKGNMSSSSFASYVTLCERIYETEFVVGDNNAVACKENTDGGMVIGGQVCSTVSIGPNSEYVDNRSTYSYLYRRYGIPIRTVGISYRCNKKTFVSESGYVMCSFANNLSYPYVFPYHPQSDEYKDIIEQKGMCAYSSSGVLRATDQSNHPIVNARVVINVINNTIPNMVTQNIVENGSKYVDNVNNPVMDGNIMSAGLPYRSAEQYKLVSSYKTLG